jgi:NAD(P)-dependent dehydrogenase (short-subunit alcohol dehydrogenase family)
MAVELAPYHIQVNAIAPCWIATEMTTLAREHPDYAEFNKMVLARTPASRWGEAVKNTRCCRLPRICRRRFRHWRQSAS